METHPQIKLRKGQHKGISVIFIEFAYDATLIQKVKAQAGSRWSMSKRCWYILKDQFNLNLFFTSLSEHAYIDYSSISGTPDAEPKLKKARVIKEKAKIPEAYTDYLIQKRYSASTQATYQNYFSDFMVYYKDKPIAGSSMFFVNKTCALCFYNMLDYEYEHLKPIHRIMYEVVKYSTDNGYSYVDIGVSQDTKAENPMTPSMGLIDFKEKFDAKTVMRNTLSIKL